jgi:chemotaxis protein histidine kinase CheA
MKLINFLKKKLKELAAERAEMANSLEIIKQKIKEADEKRSGQMATQHYHKWSHILRNLEKDLEKTRGRITAIDAEVKDKTIKLADTEREKAEELRAIEEAKRARDQRLKEIQAMGPGELAALSMEDMAILQEFELAEAAVESEESNTSDDEEPAAADEGSPEDSPAAAPAQEESPTGVAAAPAETAPPASAEENSVNEKGAIFSHALKKAQAEGPGALTLAEVDVLIEMGTGILKGPGSDEKRINIKRTIVVALKGATGECQRLTDKLTNLAS